MIIDKIYKNKKSLIFFIIIFSFIFFTFLKFVFATNIKLQDPLGVDGDILKLLYRILNFLVYNVGPIVFTLMMIIGAYQILFGGSNENLIKKGKKTIIYAIVGYALLILSLSIQYIINDLFKNS